ncbi:MAG: TolC family protein [Paludibacteraceae bacterium]|nr:TolC family protein [Paludibacteraceae bacterium]
MKKIITLCLIVLWSITAYSQVLSLDTCQLLARQNHPLLKQAGVIDELYTLRNKSVNAGNLPQIDFSGRASYQSDVTAIELKIPGFNMPELSKDQYKIYVDVKQKIYDFGVTRKRKGVEIADRNINIQQNEVELYKIKETVNTLFFNALALQENNNILMLKRQSLDERIKIVASAVKNGVSLPNELDNLRAEALLTDQQQMELLMNKNTTLSLLGILIGSEISEDVQITNPTPKGVVPSLEIKRPEIELFVLQKNKLDKSEQLLKRTHLPYLYAFAQAGYGRPGLNMLTNSFDDWYMGGVGFAWNLWDGNKTKNDRATLRVQKKFIDIAQENFERAVNSSLTQELNNIKKLENMLMIDDELVVLKEKIAKRSASALDNGTITSADYIRDLNAALQAKAMLQIHKLQLIQARVNYHTIKGD